MLVANSGFPRPDFAGGRPTNRVRAQELTYGLSSCTRVYVQLRLLHWAYLSGNGKQLGDRPSSKVLLH